jgi:hypothetical protein
MLWKSVSWLVDVKVLIEELQSNLPLTFREDEILPTRRLNCSGSQPPQ